jgi:hypothetical protein
LAPSNLDVDPDNTNAGDSHAAEVAAPARPGILIGPGIGLFLAEPTLLISSQWESERACVRAVRDSS